MVYDRPNTNDLVYKSVQGEIFRSYPAVVDNEATYHIKRN